MTCDAILPRTGIPATNNERMLGSVHTYRCVQFSSDMHARTTAFIHCDEHNQGDNSNNEIRPINNSNAPHTQSDVGLQSPFAILAAVPVEDMLTCMRASFIYHPTYVNACGKEGRG